MPIEIKTTVTNTGKTAYSLPVARGKLISMRPGETRTFDYDIFSTVDRLSKKHLERDMRKGKIVVKTSVLTNQATITVETDGSYAVKSGDGIKAAEAAAKQAKQEAPAKLKATDEVKHTEGLIEATKTTEVNTDLAGKLGVTPVDITKDEDAVATELEKQGFTATKIDTTGSVFDKPKTEGIVEVQKTAGLWQNNVGSTEAAKAEAPAENTPVEEKEEAPAEISPEDYIESLFTTKEYDILYAYLQKQYPTVKFNKAAVKKCKSFAELKEKYSL